jgi:hypothetical protein
MILEYCGLKNNLNEKKFDINPNLKFSENIYGKIRMTLEKINVNSLSFLYVCVFFKLENPK